MILSEFDGVRAEGRIILQPNRSWTWRANTCLVATLMALSGSVGTVLAYQGLWLVLPFTFLEMSVLLACLYYCVRRTHVQEVLTFSADSLVFERGTSRPHRQHTFQRYFARFLVCPPIHPWRSPRVALRCQGDELEIGSFLNGEEKADLVAALRDMVQRFDSLTGNCARQ